MAPTTNKLYKVTTHDLSILDCCRGYHIPWFVAESSSMLTPVHYRYLTNGTAAERNVHVHTFTGVQVHVPGELAIPDTGVLLIMYVIGKYMYNVVFMKRIKQSCQECLIKSRQACCP